MKKRWWIVGIVAVAIIAVVLAIYFISRGGNSETNTPSQEKPVTAGTIQVPDGPKIKVVFNGPPELKVSWEKVGMAPDGFQVQLIGTLENISEKAVKFSEIAFLLDDHQVAYDNGRTLKPGEQMKITKGFPAVAPGLDEYAKVLEVQIKGFEVIGGATTTTKPTTPSNPETTDTPAKLVYKSNPTTPGETIITFLGLANEGKYKEAGQFVDPTFTKDENWWKWIPIELLQGRKITAVQVAQEEKASGLTKVSGIIQFDNEDEEEFTFNLKKTSGGWIITD